MSEDTFDLSGNSFAWQNRELGLEVPFKIENRVYTCRIKTLLNLNHVAYALRHKGVQFNRKRFAAVIIRFRNPKIATLMFSQGKIVCTGSKKPHQARFMIYSVVQYLKDIGYSQAEVVADPGDPSCGLKIQNVVASVTLPWGINLDNLSETHSYCCNYDPDQFPGAIIRYLPLGKITILVFRSGKMVVTGAKGVDGVMRAMDLIVPLLMPFQCERESSIGQKAARQAKNIDQLDFVMGKMTLAEKPKKEEDEELENLRLGNLFISDAPVEEEGEDEEEPELVKKEVQKKRKMVKKPVERVPEEKKVKLVHMPSLGLPRAT